MENQCSTAILEQFFANPKNQETFGKFAAKYQTRIKGICLAHRLQDADAEDLTAKLLLRFFQCDVPERFVYQTKTQFYSWLKTVVRNDVLTFIRDRGRKPGDFGTGAPEGRDPLQMISDKVVTDLESACEEDLARVEQARARVKDRVAENTWRAFSMLVDEQQTGEQVAQTLGMSKVSVWKARSRIMRMLREELGVPFATPETDSNSSPLADMRA